jgi:hypothetical protein
VAPSSAALAFLIIVGGTSGVHAQDTRVYVDAGVSHARPPADVRADPATYALLGGRLAAGPAYASLYGGLAMDVGSADWVGGSLGATARAMTAGPLDLSLTGFLAAFSMGDPTPYRAITARIIPEARVRAGAASVVLRGYGGAGRSEVTDPSLDPPADVETDLWMYGGGAEYSIPAGRTQLRTGAEAYGTASGGYYAAYAGSLGSLPLGRHGNAFWSLLLKLWDTPGGGEVELSLSLNVPLTSAWSAESALGRSGPDPLLGSPAGVDGSLLIRWSAALSPAEPPPLYRLSHGSDGETVVLFRLEFDGAEAVSVIGDFSDWEPVAMTRRGDVWVVRVPVRPGLYHFGFLVDGRWHVPEDAPGRVTDEFGRSNATLVVVPGR